MPALNGWGLRRRLAIASVAFAVVLAAVVAISVALLVAVRSQQDQVVNRYFRAVTLTNTRLIDQLDAETAVRGYALTGDPSTLQPLDSFKSGGYRNDLTQLTALVGNDSPTIASFRVWDEAAQTWYATWAQPTVAEIQSDPTHRLTSAEVLTGKQLFDKVRQSRAAFASRLVAKRDAASDHLQTLTTLLFVAVLFAVLSVLLAGIALWFALNRWVLNPLSHLGAETRVVRDGDLEHPVVASGPREVREVAADVDDMRSELVEQLAQVEQARLELEEAGASLEERATELVRSNRDLEQFAYVASHDLQEPLRKVASFCQLLEQRYKGELDERADQYIAFAVDGAKRMQQLINDLLAFSRVGRSTAEFTDVPLDGCVDAALENLSSAIEMASATVERVPLPVVPGDRALLIQLFQNLIANSLKFRGADPPVIRITAELRGSAWEISCTDNGIGIEAQYGERIFVIFQRLHAKEDYEGTGIGLALCKRIIEHHGGTIRLDPLPSPGATFRFTLPTTQRSSLHRQRTQLEAP